MIVNPSSRTNSSESRMMTRYQDFSVASDDGTGSPLSGAAYVHSFVGRRKESLRVGCLTANAVV